jgi:nucleoside-diphosphate-sugar epimerase
VSAPQHSFLAAKLQRTGASISELLSSLTDDRPDAAWRRRQLGDPTPERDPLYFDCHIDAYLACFAKPEASIGQVFNFCTGVIQSVLGWEVKVSVNKGLRRTIDFWRKKLAGSERAIRAATT